MNLVGKIFVVLIFVLSLVQMSLTMTVYMTHTNWRLVADNSDTKLGPLGLKQRLEAAESELNTLRANYANIEDQQEKERKEKRDAIASLNTQLVEEQEQKKQMQEELNDSREKIRTSLAATNAAQDNANNLSKENASIRDQIKVLLDARAQTVNEHIVLDGKYVEELRKTAELQKSAQKVAAELAQAMAVLNYLNIPPDVNFLASKEPPAGVEGRVLSVSSDRGMVEISIGTDDGVRQGHRFEVQSGNGGAYVGRVEVQDVYPHKAVCRNIPGFENGVYAVGNRAVPVRERMGR